MPLATYPIFRAAAVLAVVCVPAFAFGQGTEEQQQACTPDAVKLCSDTIPDIPKTTACMKAHFSQLSPRCQTAFGEATGGAKTKAAARKPEAARPKVATRTERSMPERAERPMPERTARAPLPRREARLPTREVPDTSEVAEPQVAGYPPYPSPDAPLVRAPATSAARSQIANACRAGLIDSFTCSTTVPALIGGPAY